MIGTSTGTMKATVDLELHDQVLIDHEQFVVQEILQGPRSWSVMLVPQYGEMWVLQVEGTDVEEPMWETV